MSSKSRQGEGVKESKIFVTIINGSSLGQCGRDRGRRRRRNPTTDPAASIVLERGVVNHVGQDQKRMFVFLSGFLVFEGFMVGTADLCHGCA